MKALDALNITDSIAVSQRGLVTSAQAFAAGVGRMELSRLAANGHLERVSRGIYRASGAPSIREEAVWAAWLSLDPSSPAYFRNPLACAVSHNTAAWLMQIGELNPEPLTFTSPMRRQVQRNGLRIVKGKLARVDVITVAGLPCTTATRTVCDLIADGEDLSLVAAVLSDAFAAGLVPDEETLRENVDALGVKRGLTRDASLYDLLRRG